MLPLLILDGEILTGAKQNRVVNTSLLVAAGESLRIPVSCVEQSRWRYDEDRFTKSAFFSYASLRAQKYVQVNCSLRANRDFYADQHAIWDEVDRKQEAMAAESPTRSVGEVYLAHQEKLKEYCRAFQTVENQVGVMVFINGELMCLDAFDSADTLERLFQKMIESYALDALERSDQESPEVETDTALGVLEKLASGEVEAYPSVGLGEDLRVDAEGIAASCLVYEGKIVHLAAFPKVRDGSQEKVRPMARPSRRRRTRI